MTGMSVFATLVCSLSVIEKKITIQVQIDSSLRMYNFFVVNECVDAAQD